MNVSIRAYNMIYNGCVNHRDLFIQSTPSQFVRTVSRLTNVNIE